jgi:multiple sugar transport system ATP-binding protein
MQDTGLQDVTVVHRDGDVALRQVTLWAGPGELLVVLGPSGSGKSTLLRAVAGLTDVQSGEVFINGRQVTRLPVQKRDVAMVFESGGLLPFLDVAGNIGWGLRARHVPEAEVAERVSAQARGLRLTRLLARKPKTLSAGEQGLVGVGRALVRAPSVYLLDEPLAHLDAADRARMRRRIVEVVKGRGVTTLYVTHDQADALAIADRVAVLRDGTVVQVDTPLDLYRRPADLFVAGFVGSPPIGLLPARLVVSPASSGSVGSAGSAGSVGSAGYQVGARTLPLWTPVPPPLRDSIGRQVVLGVRPEDVYDASEECDPELVALPATVVGVEHTGAEKVVTMELAAPPVNTPGADRSELGADAARLRSRFPAGSTVRPGSSVQIAVDVARAHVFDGTTGRARWHPEVAR